MSATKHRDRRDAGVSYTGAAIEAIRPETADPIPLRPSAPRIGTIMVRFVGLLLVAIAALVLLWIR